MDLLKHDHNRWLCWHSLSVTVHVVGFVVYSYSLIWQEVHQAQSDDPALRNASAGRLFAGRWKYLTHWDHVRDYLAHSLRNYYRESANSIDFKIAHDCEHVVIVTSAHD